MCDAKLIHRYYDNELSHEQRAQVEAHLASCAECAAELEQLRRVSAMVARVPNISQIAMARIHRSIEAMNERMILRLVNRMTAVAAMVLLASTLWLATQKTTSEEQQSMVVPTTWENAAVSMTADPSPDVQMSSFMLASDTSSGSNQ